MLYHSKNLCHFKLEVIHIVLKLLVFDLNKLCLKGNFEHLTVPNSEIPPNERMPVRCLQLRDQNLLTAGIDNTIKLWDLSTNKCSLIINNPYPISSILQNPVRSHLIYSSSAREDGIKNWDLRFPSVPLLHYSEIRDRVTTFAFDGSKFIVSGNDLWAFTIAPDSTLTNHWKLGLNTAPNYCPTIISTSSLLILPNDNYSVSIFNFDTPLSQAPSLLKMI